MNESSVFGGCVVCYFICFIAQLSIYELLSALGHGIKNFRP
jgi:hypothetical protein